MLCNLFVFEEYSEHTLFLLLLIVSFLLVQILFFHDQQDVGLIDL